MSNIKLIGHAANPLPGARLPHGRALLGGRNFHARYSRRGRLSLFTGWGQP